MLRFILETDTLNKFLKSRKFSSYLRGSFVIVKPLPLRLTVILLMFLKLMILHNFIMIYEDLFQIFLILVSSQPYLNSK